MRVRNELGDRFRMALDTLRARKTWVGFGVEEDVYRNLLVQSTLTQFSVKLGKRGTNPYIFTTILLAFPVSCVQPEISHRFEA